MGKSKQELSLTSKIVLYLLVAEDVLTPWMNPYEAKRRLLFNKESNYKSTLYRLQKRGWIKFINKDAQKFIKLTKKGELEALLAKARMPHEQKWDGKWRMFMYDIPEDCKKQRHFLRDLLKREGYRRLQGSVYISPYRLNSEAVRYLKETGLNTYIRIARIDEWDDDSDLKKKFNLK